CLYKHLLNRRVSIMQSRRPNKPYAHTKIAAFIAKRLLELRPVKSQALIASEVGWKSANMLSMIASGTSKLPIERVPALAQSLNVDPAYVLRLTLDQHDLLLWPIIEGA